uniref:Uncharacterized protein n=1 Tax=Panagrolaimus sp. ES5 TaxID=591445 RepID=A0AC34GP91_9BILA
MKDIVEANQNTLRPEELFEEVFKWAENRAMEKQKCIKKINLNETIKAELSDILPLIKFKEMSDEFIYKFVCVKSFLFIGRELGDIFRAAFDKVYVRIFDENRTMMKGFLNCPEVKKVADVIQLQKDVLRSRNYWPTKQQKPSESSKITKNDKINWYLIYDNDGDLGYKHRKELNDSDYILAEMFAEDGFKFYQKNKTIEIYQYGQ